jgi:hypothetical protein
MIAAMTARFNALFQYFVLDDLLDLRPAPLGEKPGTSESSGESHAQYV